MSYVRVLVVDDFDPWRRALSSRLRKQQEMLIIGEASDGLEAVQKAEELQPDLILLDIGPPGGESKPLGESGGLHRNRRSCL